MSRPRIPAALRAAVRERAGGNEDRLSSGFDFGNRHSDISVCECSPSGTQCEIRGLNA